jgi:hypothetical protein
MGHFLFNGSKSHLHQHIDQPAFHFKTVTPASGPHDKKKIFSNGPVRKKLKILKDDPDFSPEKRYLLVRDTTDIKAGNADVSEPKGKIGIQCLKQGRFARAGPAHEKYKIPFFNFKIQTVEYSLIALKNVGIFYSNNRVGRKHKSISGGRYQLKSQQFDRDS